MPVKKRRTYAKSTVAARLEPEVYREFMRDCEASSEKVADNLRSILKEHYKNRKRKLDNGEEPEDPLKGICRQAVAEELAPLKAALTYLADITCKVTNLEELLREAQAGNGTDAASNPAHVPQGALISRGKVQNGLADLIRQQAERLAWLTPVILSQYRMISILHTKMGGTYNLLKYVATNPECTLKIQGERRRYLEAMYPTWENQMRAQEEKIKAEATQEAARFNLEPPAEISPSDLLSEAVNLTQNTSDKAELGPVGL